MSKIKAAVLVALGVLAGVFIWQSDIAMYAELSRIREAVFAYGMWAPAAFIAFYALATIAFVPGAPLTIASGALFGAWFGTLYALIGAVVGALVAFAVTRYLGASFAHDLLKTRFKKLARYETKLSEKGFKTVVFLRLVPVFPFNGLNFVLGLTQVSFREYALATAVGIVPGTFLYVLVGASLLSQNIANIALATVAALAFGFLMYRFRKRLYRYVFK